MDRLIARLREGQRHLGGGMVRVSDFLNHHVDAPLLGACGRELARHWRDAGVTKVLTAETSGIPPALTTALVLEVPLIYARKRRLGTLGAATLSASAPSPTHGGSYELTVSAPLLTPSDRVLIIDDILASGHTIIALAQIIAQAQATLVGVGAVIEKEYSEGRPRLAPLGVPIVALAIIVSASDSGLVVRAGNDEHIQS